VNFCESRKYLFITMGIVDRSQHRHGESYPWWALGTYLRTKGWIKNISLVAQ
jgi:hypothetical protein